MKAGIVGKLLASKQTERKRCSFFWEVKGGNAKMYLAGTVHIVPESFFPLNDEIITRFDECSTLVVEVILDDKRFNGIEITEDILNNKNLTYEDGDSLYNHFPKEKIIALRDYMIKNKLCPTELSAKFYKLKPAVVNYILREGLYKKAGINLNSIGIDFYFMKRAKEMGKTLMELESKEFQDKILEKSFGKSASKKSDKDNNSNHSKDNPKNTEDAKLPIINSGYFNRFIKLRVMPWIFGNYVDRCGSLYGDEKRISKHREKLISLGSPLIGNRDEEMYKRLLELLKTKNSYFVAVGAAHLIGKGSIIDKLQKKGYTITRIC